MHARRTVLLLALPFLVFGCASVPAPDPQARAALAPTGTLRVGVYPGSPTSLVRNPRTGEAAGVALELGQELGRRLGVPVRVVEFVRVAQVLDALKAGAVDLSFTNATEARARDVDFTQPLIRLELGYLVPGTSRIGTAADIDRPGVRVGVSQGSSSQGTLTRTFKQARVLPADSLKVAAEMLRRGEVDAFATNKGILHEMLDELPGFRILDGRWGLEHLALAIPKGREAGMPYLRQFAQDLRSGPLLSGIAARAGLRGMAGPD